jgi:hypothetical protein
VGGSCEHGHKPSGSIRLLGLNEWLSDWRLLKEDSAPWSCRLGVIFIERHKEVGGRSMKK